MIKVISILFALATLCSCSSVTVTEDSRQQKVVDHTVSAILLSDDMCFKMCVLKYAFYDNDPLWERGLRRLIRDEEWVFAKVNYIDFYLDNVPPDDKEYVDSLIAYVKTDPVAIEESEFWAGYDRIVDFWSRYHAEQEAAALKARQDAIPYDSSISDEDALNIAEATFRYQFEHNGSAVQQDAPAYFLSLFGHDPSDRFLTRFSNNNPKVRSGSEFEIGAGLRFSVSKIKRIDATTVEVSGGYYEAQLSASGCQYTVEFVDGQWVVTKRKLLYIS